MIALRLSLLLRLLSPDLVLDQFRHEVDEESALPVPELPHRYLGKDVRTLSPFGKVPFHVGAPDQDFGDDLVVRLRPIDFVDLTHIIGIRQAV